MNIVISNGVPIVRCVFFSEKYGGCVLHHTICKCDDYISEDKPLNGNDIDGGGIVRGEDGNIISYGIVGPPGEPGKKITNYDRLLSKTPEELAEMLSRSGKYFCCDTTKCDPHSERCDYGDECYDCWLDWLRQEAEK